MKTLLKYLESYRTESILAPVFKMLEALFELVVPLVMVRIIDIGIADRNETYVLKMGGVLILLGIVGLCASITAQYFAAKAATGAATEIRHSLFSHIHDLSFSQLDSIGADTLITRMTSDINQVQNGINMGLRLLLRSPFVVFGAMIMAFLVDVKAALIFLVVVPVLFCIVISIMRVTIPGYRKTQGKLDRVTLTTRENLTGARVLRAFHMEDEETERFAHENEELTTLQKHVGMVSGLMNPLTYIALNAGLIVLLWTGALRIDAGSLTQGEIVALVNYISQILIEIIKLANLVVTITRCLACWDRVNEVLSIEPGGTERSAGDGKAAPVLDAPAVEFDHVSLSYGAGQGDAISDITFTADKGQTIGIIGGTGSGKSSLVDLIPRFYDATKGTVRVFGHDVREYDPAYLRSMTGMVFQKTDLFSGSIRDNIRWGMPDADEEAVTEAAEASQSMEFIRTKEGALDFHVGQSGRNLSGGQKQRLTIARALVRKPPILIMDDSASALDFATDAALRQAIRALSGESTIFIVSQRAASIRYADLILVLDDGRIVGKGKHEDLIRSNDVYREIYFSQFPEEAEA